MDIIKKLATYGTQDAEKNKTKTQHNIYWTPLCANKTQLTFIRGEPSYRYLEVETNRTSLLCGNRNRHHNMEIRTYGQILGQHIILSRWATRRHLTTEGVLVVYLCLININIVGRNCCAVHIYYLENVNLNDKQHRSCQCRNTDYWSG